MHDNYFILKECPYTKYFKCWIKLYEGNGLHDATNVANTSRLPYSFAISKAQEATYLELSKPTEKPTAMKMVTPTLGYVRKIHYINVMVNICFLFEQPDFFFFYLN